MLRSINVRARRAVELGDGGFVVGFMLEDDAPDRFAPAPRSLTLTLTLLTPTRTRTRTANLTQSYSCSYPYVLELGDGGFVALKGETRIPEA